MTTVHTSMNKNQQHLRSSIAECTLALDDEIAFVRKSGGQKTYLSDGRSLGTREGRFIYSFTADSELRFPDDTPVDLEYKRKKYSGTIVSIDGLDIIVALTDNIGTTITTALLYTEPWFLLQQLQERLQAICADGGKKYTLSAALLNQHTPAQVPDVERAAQMLRPARRHVGATFNCNAEQLCAVGHILLNPISFIWGPPGTGKTTTLGMAVAALVEQGESVLVLAHSNVAVDVAMKSIASHLAYSEEYAAGHVLRFGPAALTELNAFPKVHVRGVVRQQNPALIAQVEELERQRRKLVKKTRASDLSSVEQQTIKDAIGYVKLQLKPLRELLKAKESELVSAASVVGCTLSKATIAAEIVARCFDAVIIDEASMAYIPHCLFAAGQANKRIAIFGDFRQLAPIAQAESERVQRWLRRDIFEASGITQQVNAGQSDPRLVMLSKQHRMHPAIAAVINTLFYSSHLRNGEDVAQRAASTVAARPGSGHALVFYDMRAIHAHCFSDKETHSRFNPISALAAVQLARQSLADDVLTVGIVTPYSAQARLIRRLIKDMGLPDDRVRVATVHRFQGSENSVIIFDTVDGEPQHKPGKLLQGHMGSTAMRLANVAVSRAQGKFVGLFNRDYLTSHLGITDIFAVFMRELAMHSRIAALNWSHITSPDVSNEQTHNFQLFDTFQQASAAIERDIAAATEEIALYWPVPINRQFPVAALQRCDSSKIRCYISGAGCRSFPSDLKNTQITDVSSKLALGLLGIDHKRLWLALDPKNSSTPLLRLDLPHTVALLFSFWRLVPEHDLAPGKVFEMDCPLLQCKQKMWITTGKYGAYLKCNGCGYTRNITPAVAVQIAHISSITCGYCGAMVKGRKSDSGTFLGCSNYPACDWTMPLENIV